MVELYSNNCPLCKTLKRKIVEKGIPFLEISDPKKVKEQGFMSFPVLFGDNRFMGFKEALDYVSSI